MPGTINGLWIGEALGLIEKLSISSFLKQGHDYHLHCYGPMGGVPDGVIVKDANEILPASSIFRYECEPGRGSVAVFANLFRYKLLLERGGWWADTDVVCLRPFAFTEQVVLATELTSQGGIQVANAVLKLPAGHPIAQLCYQAASQDAERAKSWGRTGPRLLTQMMKETSTHTFAMKPVVFCPIPWWEWQLALAADDRWTQLVTDDSHAVHLWHEMWRRAGIDRRADFPPMSMFAQMLDKYGVAYRPPTTA